MYILDIIKALEDGGEKISWRITNNRQIYGVKRCAPAAATDEPYQADTIYIMGSAPCGAGRLPENLMVCGEPTDNIDEYVLNRITAESGDAEAVFDAVYKILTDSFRIQSLQLRMVDSVAHGKGLRGAIDEAAKVLNTSIVVMDMTGKIIVNSMPFLIKDVLWQDSIEKGYCPPFFVDHVRDVRNKHSGESASGPLMRTCASNNLFYMASRVHIGGELCGYVFMIQDNNDFNRLCQQVLPMIRDEAVKYLQENSSFGNPKDYIYGNLLEDIISGIPTDQIQSRMLGGGVRFPDRMCVAVLKPRYFHGDNYVRDTLFKTVKTMFPNDHYVYYRKSLVVLFSLSDSKVTLSDENSASLQSICDQEHLICGISNPFTKPSSIKHYYEQAVKTIELAGTLNYEGDVFLYLDLSIYDMISSAAAQRKIVFCCHPALAILRSYDTRNGSQLYDTLRAFAENGFNQAQTAGELYLHRNTLSYRKQKIISLTGIDFDDWKTQFLIYYSFLLENYNDKAQQ